MKQQDKPRAAYRQYKGERHDKFRISKRPSRMERGHEVCGSRNGNRGRGRPRELPDSWTKKLIVLRFCGLERRLAQKILQIQYPSITCTSERTAQSLLRELAGFMENADRGCDMSSPTRLSTPSHWVARERSSFLRIHLRRRRRTRPSGNYPRQAQWIEKGSSRNTTSSQFPIESMQSLSLPDSIGQVARSANLESSTTPSERGSISTQNDALRSKHGGTETTTLRSSIISAALNVPAREMRRSIDSRIRKTLRSHQYAPSFISDIVSLVNRRYSRSSYNPSIQLSDVPVEAPLEQGLPIPPSATGHRMYQASLSPEKVGSAADQTLLRQYCSAPEDCAFRWITNATDCGSGMEILNWEDFNGHFFDHTYQYSTVMKPHSPYDALHFAVRLGAPLAVVLRLIACTDDVSRINENGQTFLFYIHPRLFKNGVCTCSSPHSSTFECLVTELNCRSFPFDRLDDHGRNFLSYLSGRADFNLEWISHMVAQFGTWKRWVERVSQIRDSHGLVLADYMVNNPTYELESQSTLRFLCEPLSLEARSENHFGQTTFHDHVRRNCSLENIFDTLPLEHVIDQINKYDIQGNTPIMTYINKALVEGISELTICANVLRFLEKGANINVRSRNGSTLLHFAIQGGLPNLFQVLLQQNARANITDDHGHDALFYMKIKLSHDQYDEPKHLARTLRATGHLLSYINPLGRILETKSTVKSPTRGRGASESRASNT